MMQIVKQTKEEKIAMYMKLSKKELAAMLTESNELIETLIKPTVSYQQITGVGSGIQWRTTTNLL